MLLAQGSKHCQSKLQKMRICAKRSIEYYKLELNFQCLRFCWPLKCQMALALPNGIIMPVQGRRNFKQKNLEFCCADYFRKINTSWVYVSESLRCIRRVRFV